METNSTLETLDEVSPAPSPVGSPARFAVSVGLGLVLIPVTSRWLAEIEWVRYSDNATTQALFPHAVFLLVLLTGLSAAVRSCTSC